MLVVSGDPVPIWLPSICNHADEVGRSADIWRTPAKLAMSNTFPKKNHKVSMKMSFLREVICVLI